MARALFICEVVLDSLGRAFPATNEVRNAATGSFPCRWTITTFRDSRRIAIGLAEVTAAQLSALQADTRIRAVGLVDNWQTNTWGSLSNAQQTSWTNFMTNRGLDTSGIGSATTLKEVIDLISNRIRPGRRLMHLETELSMNFGV